MIERQMSELRELKKQLGEANTVVEKVNDYAKNKVSDTFQAGIFTTMEKAQDKVQGEKDAESKKKAEVLKAVKKTYGSGGQGSLKQTGRNHADFLRSNC